MEIDYNMNIAEVATTALWLYDDSAKEFTVELQVSKIGTKKQADW